jgi:hypothetical protein
MDLQAKQEMDAANVQASDIRYAGDRSLGTIQAQQAANGVDVSSGSAADVAAESAANIETDALRALYSGRLKKWQLNSQASITRAEGKAAQRQGYMDAAATLLGSAVKVFGGGTGAGKTPSGFAPGTSSTIRPNSAGGFDVGGIRYG